MDRRFELLAPARDLACGLAALECGADAVYIGAERFGARRAAANSRADIARLVERAHLFHAKVYAAVNTILRDDELEAARRLIEGLHADGVDAVIVQDFGLLELPLPPVALIASTQMHNATPEQARFLRDLGFQRAILARELSLEEIAAVAAAAPGLELEAFVHGALCVSYSGRCYLSYALGGRSANRGECAQPCRKPYDVGEADGRPLARGCHALCLKDLDLAGRLGELIAAGVTSFKIEGRLKDELWVKNTVLRYRRALDAALARAGGRRASSGTVRAVVEPDPGKTFGRGGTTYFLSGPDPAMHSHEAPASLGEPVGRVLAVDGARARVSGAEIRAGDGLAFFDAAGRLRGTGVNAAGPGWIVAQKPAGLAAGVRLYRNRDLRWLRALAAARIERRIAVDLELARVSGGVELRMRDEDGVAARALWSGRAQAPARAEAAAAAAARQLAKLGGTPFIARRVALPREPVLLPLAELNALRRRCAADLERARREAHPRLRRRAERPGARHPEAEPGFEANVLNAAAARFLRARGVSRIVPALESGPVPAGARLMTCRYCLRRALARCPGGGPAPDLVLRDGAVSLRLRFDCRACRMEVYRERGRRSL